MGSLSWESDSEDHLGTKIAKEQYLIMEKNNLLALYFWGELHTRSSNFLLPTFFSIAKRGV